jgi:iron complex transport system substrate-binding protein
LAGAAILVLVCGCETPARPTDISDSARRIVSLTPSVTESLFALGAGPEVVGVSQYCDYPPEVRRLPKVGTFVTPNIEAIAALRPTLVIGLATSSDLRAVHALEGMGIPTLMTDENSIAGIEQSIQRIGDRIGRANEARRLVAEIRYHIGSVEERLKGVPTRSVLMVVGHQPMVAVGRGTYLDELLTIAHANNIADVSPQAWPRLSVEYIIASRPDVILDGQMGSDPFTPDKFWAKYPSIPAVRNRRILGYPEDPTLHPGPRIWQTLEILARRIHPEAFHVVERPQAQETACE